MTEESLKVATNMIQLLHAEFLCHLSNIPLFLLFLAIDGYDSLKLLSIVRLLW